MGEQTFYQLSAATLIMLMLALIWGAMYIEWCNAKKTAGIWFDWL